MIAKTGEEFGFADGLRGVSANSTDADKWNRTAAIGAIQFFGGDFQNRLEETETRFANGKLRGVNADGHAAGASGDVIACERALTAFVEAAIRIERQGMRRDDGAAGEELKFRIESGHERFC